jgi:hypothetical protein
MSFEVDTPVSTAKALAGVLRRDAPSRQSIEKMKVGSLQHLERNLHILRKLQETLAGLGIRQFAGGRTSHLVIDSEGVKIADRASEVG